MKKNSVALPNFSPDWSSAKTVEYAELLASFKDHLTLMPKFVTSLKKADNESWQQLIDDLGKHIQEDPNLSKFVREIDKDGVRGLSIGDPNWFTVAVVGAFAAGYAIGTACYKLGPCNFVK